LGSQSVVIVVGDKVSSSILVTVNESSTATYRSLTVVSAPTKLSYVEKKETLNLSGLVLRGQKIDGTWEVIPSSEITAANLSNYDLSRAGTYPVVLTYKGYQVQYAFTVTVYKSKYTELTGDDSKFKKTYVKGDSLDLSGLVVRGLVRNDTTPDVSYDLIDSSKLTVNGYNNDVLGSQNVFFTFEGLRYPVNEYSFIQVTVYELGQTVTFNAKLVGNGDDGGIVLYNGADKVTGDIVLYTRKSPLVSDTLTINVYPYSEVITDSYWATGYSVDYYIDNQAVVTAGYSITLNANNYAYKIPHTITLIVTRDSIKYSKSLTFTVEREAVQDKE